MKWSTEAWNKITPVYDKIIAMPFNQELSNGSLDKSKFIFYLAQDAYYLLAFGRTLNAIAAKLTQAEHVLMYNGFAAGAIAAERSLHESYFAEFGIHEIITPSPSTLLYTNYILNQAAYANVEVALAAVLPCFWIYKAVGDYILKQQSGDENPYKRWIDMYAGEDFAVSVQRAINFTDLIAESAAESLRQSMFQAFEMATKMEWMFWDSAYQKEPWKI
ncbi:TenA family protein [Pedobacter sp. AW1-32]|uniref:TenA family protein n=1 Tax=Pedobacter sp. AW1-32 TaxID=3383026 RepID=UPI003FEF00AC